MNGYKHCQKCINAHYGSCNGCEYDGLNTPTKFIECTQIPIKPMPTIEPLDLNPLTINKDNISMKCEELASLLIKKNHDYGNSVQDQFKEYGLTSILIRIDDKIKRLKNLQKNKQQVNDESLIDTLDDLAGYALLGSICLEIEKEENQND